MSTAIFQFVRCNILQQYPQILARIHNLTRNKCLMRWLQVGWVHHWERVPDLPQLYIRAVEPVNGNRKVRGTAARWRWRLPWADTWLSSDCSLLVCPRRCRLCWWWRREALWTVQWHHRRNWWKAAGWRLKRCSSLQRWTAEWYVAIWTALSHLRCTCCTHTHALKLNYGIATHGHVANCHISGRHHRRLSQLFFIMTSFSLWCYLRGLQSVPITNQHISSSD